MKEKAICVLMILLLALSLTGCGERGKVSGGNTGAVTDNSAPNGAAQSGTAGAYTTDRDTAYNAPTGYSARTYNIRTGNGRSASFRTARGAMNNDGAMGGTINGAYGSTNYGVTGYNDAPDVARPGGIAGQGDYSLTGYGAADRINRDMAARDRDRIDQRQYNTGTASADASSAVSGQDQGVSL